jgi:hypothetical protein
MICKKCIHKEVCKHKSKSVYECEHFADGTIKNQYDRIRNMSIDEMAEFLKATIEDCEKYCAFTKNGKCNSFGVEDKCAEGIKQWLETEVEK